MSRRSSPNTFDWQYEDRSIPVAWEEQGKGAPLLLLPALSTISTRQEMAGLAARLSPDFRVVQVDWPGFGDSGRPALRYEPELYLSFLRDFTMSVIGEPTAVIAAGHAAGYVMRLASRQQETWTRAVLVTPTWRGPMPTAMGPHRRTYRFLEQLVRTPLLGPLLYWLNTTRPVLRFMLKEHVYAEETRVTGRMVRRKQQVSRQPGARFASSAFVTGRLDPAGKRREFIRWAENCSVPLMVAAGRAVPTASQKEIDALREAQRVTYRLLPGSLALHEEHPAALARTARPFLLD